MDEHVLVRPPMHLFFDFRCHRLVCGVGGAHGYLAQQRRRYPAGSCL